MRSIIEEERERRWRESFLRRAVEAGQLPPPALNFPLEGEGNWIGRLAEFVHMRPEIVSSLLAEIYNLQFYAGVYLPNPAAYQIARVPMEQWQCGACLPFEVKGLKEMKVLTADPFSKTTTILFTNVRVLSGEVRVVRPVVAPLCVVEDGLRALEDYVVKNGVHFRAPLGKLRAA